MTEQNEIRSTFNGTFDRIGTKKGWLGPEQTLLVKMASEKASRGILIGLSGFTPDAIAFAKGAHIELITGDDLISLIKELPSWQQQDLSEMALRGDYSTPTCPRCDIKMVHKSGKMGKPDFWGCRNYPRCKAPPIPYKDFWANYWLNKH